MLRGQHINLRLIDEEDVEWLRETRNKHSDNFFTQDQITPQQQRAWYQKYSESTTDRMFILQLKDGTKIGTLALYNINVSDRSAEVGRTLLLPEFRGQGYMEDALKILMNYAFTTMRLWVLKLSVFLDNSAAITLYHKCGFRSTPRPILYMEATNVNKDFSKSFCMGDFEDGD